ncbi:hypothetical protein [Nocardia farcinica]|uniref:Uncharacterized protein n=1 Tax=Nocardia farcinica (strain IFM 10152) TaxID=247156 RepID=Q5YMQ4_NOCFA|nr:hypothetical protein [Nocardia farcinica]MBF6410870.1 hypothetical protein [Nocardia farcinica]UEX26020.1 hypothetical protein LMJ57_29680 [Nocardia farcinica]BAD60537.1 hypothetical protein PNF1_120 [Nocardia farcinica IFM 10152]
MTSAHAAGEPTDYFAPVYAILDRWAADGAAAPDPVPVILGDGSHATMTRDWLTFPRTEGTISGKSMSLRLLEKARGTLTPSNRPTDEKDR